MAAVGDVTDDDSPNHAPTAMLPALYAIMSADPSGWSHREPSDADHADHAAWAVRTYGREVWATYARGGWADRDDEPLHVEY